jgi:hypothetical protein
LGAWLSGRASPSHGGGQWFESTSAHQFQVPELFAGSVVKAPVQVDVRLIVIAALVILTVCLAIGFVRIAFAIRRDYEMRFRRIRKQLEENATSVIDGLLRKER